MTTGTIAKTVVITGASSGIGKATAVACAQRGYRLVLAARREKALNVTAEACRQHGAEVLVVPTVISSQAAVRELSLKAIETYGSYDVWINDAGVYMDGTFLETPMESYRRVIDVNLFGSIYGMREALTQFKKQGHGVLINVSSVFGMAAAPYVSAYCASKFAIRAISQSLRAEFRKTPVRICTVLPATIDTPLYRHAANFAGKQVLPVKPVYTPELVARAIVSTLEHPKDEVYVGAASRLVSLCMQLFPKLTLARLARHVESQQFGNARVPPSEGNLFAPMEEGTDSSGGWL